jgi:hypothetical protein
MLFIQVTGQMVQDCSNTVVVVNSRKEKWNGFHFFVVMQNKKIRQQKSLIPEMTQTCLTRHDVINVILKYLCWVDRMAVKIADPKSIGLINKKLFDVRTIVKHRLGKLIKNPEKFLLDLKKYRNYLTGSFLLKCLYGVEWVWNRYDIYYEHEISKGSYLHENYCINVICEFCSDFVLCLDNHNSGFVDDKPCPVEAVQKIVNMNPLGGKNSVSLKHVTIKTNVFKYLDMIGDLSICKVLFDGENLYIRYLDHLLYRKTHAMKYSDCFVLSNLLNPKYLESLSDNSKNHVIVGMWHRREKYKRRGFKIISHDDFSVGWRLDEDRVDVVVNQYHEAR